MNKSEFWFLNAAALQSVPLFSLIRPEEMFFELFLSPHNLDPQAVAEILCDLLEKGDIVLNDNPHFLPTAQEIEHGFLKDQEMYEGIYEDSWYYQLTAQGGIRWEEVAQPDWDLFQRNGFIPESETDTEHEGLVMIATNKALIEDVLDKHLLGFNSVPGSVKWDEVSPWQPLYWKTFPTGYRMRCLLTNQPESADLEGSEKAAAELKIFGRRWHKNL